MTSTSAERQQQATERQQKQQTEVTERQRPPTTAQALAPQGGGVSLTTEAGVTRIADSAKLADALVRLASQDEPPLRFAAGADALATIEQKAKNLLNQADACRELSSDLAHDDASATAYRALLAGHRKTQLRADNNSPSCGLRARTRDDDPFRMLYRRALRSLLVRS